MGRGLAMEHRWGCEGVGNPWCAHTPLHLSYCIITSSCASIICLATGVQQACTYFLSCVCAANRTREVQLLDGCFYIDFVMLVGLARDEALAGFAGRGTALRALASAWPYPRTPQWAMQVWAVAIRRLSSPVWYLTDCCPGLA